MGISAAGAGVTHLASGSFVQTSTGTLGLRISSNAADKLNINGVARLGGTLSITGDSVNVYPAARYTLVTANAGLSGAFGSFNSNLASATNLFYDANNVYLNVYAFTNAQTQQSLVNNVSALQSTFTLQNSVLANSFAYDCSEFGSNGICISAGGRNTAVSAANGLNNTSALLIAAYKVHPQVRIGAYADQNLSVNNAGSTVNLGNNTPLIGLFSAWNERLDGTGTEVKVSAAYGQKNTTVSITLGLVILHIAAAVVMSLIQKENLVRSMVTGKKTGLAEQAIRFPHYFIGLILTLGWGYCFYMVLSGSWPSLTR